MHADISRELLAAYQATEYWVGWGANAFCLHIGKYSAALAQLLRELDSDSAAFISAFNPFRKSVTATVILLRE